jgi:hypothetical protein
MRHAPLTCVPLLLVAVTACNSAEVVAARPTCRTPSAALVQRITELAPPGSHFTVVKTAGEKAEKPSTWWVGVQFTTRASRAPQTGIWAVGGGLDGHGTLLAVSPIAQQWSLAVHADTSASQIEKTAGQVVLACLSGG